MGKYQTCSSTTELEVSAGQAAVMPSVSGCESGVQKRVLEGDSTWGLLAETSGI